MNNSKSTAKTLILILSVLMLSLAFSGCKDSSDISDGIGNIIQSTCRHSYTEETVPPTCTEEGYTTHTCSKCKKSYNDAYTQKIAHPYKSVVVSPTCSAEGYTEHTCLVCGDSYNDAVTEKGEHKYNKTVTAPTCVAEGYTTHICSGCGDTYTDTVTEKTAHRFNASPCVYCSKDEITESIIPDTEWYNADSIIFTITTAEQLAGLSELVNSGTDLTGQTVYLGADIDLGYNEWIPVGNADYAFSGTFDGDGYTVSGLKINATYSYVGLFGNVSGTVREFTVADASVYVKNDCEYVSVACGYSTNEISDVKVSGFIDALKSSYVGGVAGSIGAQITKSSSSVVVNGLAYVGGVAGNMTVASAVLSELTNSGTVCGGDYTGGLIGYVTATGTLQTDYLSNTGSVTGTQQIGGIFGYVGAKVGSSVYSATVSADISGEYYVGGIVGKADNVSISHCNNDGSTVTANSYYSDGTNFYVWLGGYVGAGYSVDNCTNNVEINYNSRGSYVGGIAGYIVSSVLSCENNGNITGLNYVGGVAGMINTTSVLTVKGLKNNGNIFGGDYVGGIVGKYASTAATTLSTLENNGDIVSNYCAGGIIGWCMNGSAVLTAADIVNYGDVTVTYDRVGGLFGNVDGPVGSLIKNSTSSANITGAYRVGGLVGYTAAITVQDCSNEGSTITATSWYTEGSTDYVWLGGYAGHGYKITGCTNNSDITYDGTGIYVGGIVGYATNVIQNCTNNGDVTSKSSYVGGIVGTVSAHVVLDFANISNSGNITGVNFVAGFAGSLQQALSLKGNVNYKNETYKHYYCTSTTLNAFENNAQIKGVNYVGAVIGCVSVSNSWTSSSYEHCQYFRTCTFYGDHRLIATNIDNLGEVIGNTNIGEIFGSFSSDAPSTLTTCTVTGKITVNGEVKEGTYDVGSSTNLTLSGREVYVPETETPDTETPEDSENTENSAE